MHGGPDRGGPGGAGVGHVVDGDAGLADLLLEALAEHVRRLHEAAHGQHLHVVDGGAGVGQGAERRPPWPGRCSPCRGSARTWSSSPR